MAVIGRRVFDGRHVMRVCVFASGVGGNFLTAVLLARRAPDLLDVVLLVSDRPRAGAVELARRHAVPTIIRDFTAECGRASDCRTVRDLARYRARAEAFHDRVDDAIAQIEDRAGRLDLLVFAYRRWVHGRLLKRFNGRIINQHPGDLTILTAQNRRALTGGNPVFDALRAGHRKLRTSTFLVDEGHDTGPIVCQGPALECVDGPVTQRAADDLEARLKVVSDRPSLVCALTLIGRGAVSADSADRCPDGSARVCLLGAPLPFGGVDMGRQSDASRSRLPDALRAEVRDNIRRVHEAHQAVRLNRGPHPVIGGPDAAG